MSRPINWARMARERERDTALFRARAAAERAAGRDWQAAIEELLAHGQQRIADSYWCMVASETRRAS